MKWKGEQKGWEGKGEDNSVVGRSQGGQEDGEGRQRRDWVILPLIQLCRLAKRPFVGTFLWMAAANVDIYLGKLAATTSYCLCTMLKCYGSGALLHSTPALHAVGPCLPHSYRAGQCPRHQCHLWSLQHGTSDG